MKIYVLNYCYYEDSYTKGVYTEFAMNQKLSEFASIQREKNDTIIEAGNKIIAEKQLERKKLIAQADGDLLVNQRLAKERGNKELYKTYKKNRKTFIKQAERIGSEIYWLEHKREQMNRLTEKQLADNYMHANHLGFKEFYVIENAQEGDHLHKW